MSALSITAAVILAAVAAGIASWLFTRHHFKPKLAAAGEEARALLEEKTRLQEQARGQKQALAERDQALTEAKEAADALRGDIASLQGEREEAKTEAGRLEEKLEGRDQEIERLSEALSRAEGKAEKHRETAKACSEKITRLEAEKEQLSERLGQQEKDLERIQEKFAQQFENLATRIFEEKSEKFVAKNEEQVGQILSPLKEKIGQFEKQVRESQKENIKARSKLEARLERLSDLNHQLSEDAQDLAAALEGQSKTQGDWGEMILARLLEESGLREGSEYSLQESVKGEDGKRLRPDVIIKLPKERCLVIDSKVSIRAYKRYCQAEEEETRGKALKEHIQALRSHCDALGSKRYDKALASEGSPDFVLMFVPVEPAFTLALRESESIYQEAHEQGVILVSPTTLLATLSMVENIWENERRIQNVEAIAERGGHVLDKIRLVMEAFSEVGNRLNQAQDSYSKARKRLVEGRGNLKWQAEQLRELGAKSDTPLPEVEQIADVAR